MYVDICVYVARKTKCLCRIFIAHRAAYLTIFRCWRVYHVSWIERKFDLAIRYSKIDKIFQNHCAFEWENAFAPSFHRSIVRWRHEAMKRETAFFLASFEDKNGTYHFRIYRIHFGVCIMPLSHDLSFVPL